MLLHFACVVVAYSGIDLLFFDSVLFYVRIVVLNQGLFSSLRTLRNGGYAIGIWWPEATDAAKLAARCRTFPL